MNRGDLLGILSRTPDRRWPDGALHHGARFLLLLSIALFVSALFPVSPVSDAPPVERGGVLEEDVVAEVPFPVYKSDLELQREQQEAAARVDPIFVFDSTAVDTMLADLDGFFARADSIASGPADVASRRLRALLGSYAIPNGPEEVELLLDQAQRTRLERILRDVVLDELPRGIARAGDLQDAGPRLRIAGMDRVRPVATDSVLTTSDFYDQAELHVPLSVSAAFEQLHNLLLIRFVVPSLLPDWTATEMARDQARAAVDPIKTRIMRGQRIVPAREPVTDEHLERYRAYQQELERRGDGGGGTRGLRSFGGFLFNLITLSLFGVLLYFYRPDVYRELRHVVVLAALIMALVAVAALVATHEHAAALIPIAFPALVVAMLWDGRLALNLSLVMAVLLSGQPPFIGLVALLSLVTGGAVASLSVRVVRRRAEIWGFIALIAGAYVLVGLVLGLLRGWGAGYMLTFSAWGGVNAVASAFAAMGFLPLLEGVTRITTDQTLLELADVNRPLLRRLSLEAPGTYAHSINVANLAEAAAQAIHANALLTRVGVYYHDVGKIDRPHYFIENQPGGRNPHDKLKPDRSAQLVRDHVIKGIELADEAKLPDCIQAFILEHHGTQSISFFFDQAKKAAPDGELDPADFAYPGPRPQSKETAIAMLADSVESAARVLPDPTPDSIRELVDRIVRWKMDAGQLAETPLTLRELTAIKEQFVSVLAGMYHQRIDYPTAPGDGDESGPDAGDAEEHEPTRDDAGTEPAADADAGSGPDAERPAEDAGEAAPGEISERIQAG